MVKDIKKNLTNIVVIIGLIGSIGAGFAKFGKMETQLKALSTASAPDVSGIKNNSKDIAVLQKEIELLNLQIKEMKVAASNPLGN